jgi:hypothetical protein
MLGPPRHPIAGAAASVLPVERIIGPVAGMVTIKGAGQAKPPERGEALVYLDPAVVPDRARTCARSPVSESERNDAIGFGPGEESDMPTLPEVRVGEPICYEALTLFPLFTEPHARVDYLLSDEAIASGVVTVEEIGEAGTVPNLLVSNEGDARVLFIEGEELRGAKQNRVLNTSVLVAAHSKTTIPVSCVEQGRWRYRSRQFGSSGTHSSSKLRHILKSSVALSAVSGRGHGSDQSKVWGEVSRQMESLGSVSESAAMSDTYDSHRDHLAEFRQKLTYVGGATGLAVVVGKTLVAVDLFDKPATCRKAWDRLLSGSVLDALEAGAAPRGAEADDVQDLLGRLRAGDWQQTPAVGEGEEYRSGSDQTFHASALLFGGAVVHGSVTVAG